MKHRNRKGFTLIELIIVVVILGILGTMAVTYFTTAIDNSAKSSVENPARDFVKSLNALAETGTADYTVNGTTGSLTDRDPRKSVYLLRMLEMGDIPDQERATTALGGGSLRVLVYNGDGTAHKWTRLTCEPTTTCLKGPGGFDNTTSTHIAANSSGKLPGPYTTAGASGEVIECIMLHANGKNIFIGWPTAYGASAIKPTNATRPTISNDISKACSGPGLTSAAIPAVTSGAVSYEDLAGTTVSDTSWES